MFVTWSVLATLGAAQPCDVTPGACALGTHLWRRDKSCFSVLLVSGLSSPMKVVVSGM